MSQPKPLHRRLALVFLILTGFALMGLQPAGAQTGADLSAGISGKKTVKNGATITYTITGKNVGGSTATGVQLAGWVPDWFNFVGENCGTGTLDDDAWTCDYADLAPGARVRMQITVQMVAPEKTMFEQGFASAANDLNTANDTAVIRVKLAPRR